MEYSAPGISHFRLLTSEVASALCERGQLAGVMRSGRHLNCARTEDDPLGNPCTFAR